MDKNYDIPKGESPTTPCSLVKVAQWRPQRFKLLTLLPVQESVRRLIVSIFLSGVVKDGAWCDISQYNLRARLVSSVTRDCSFEYSL